MTYSDTINQEDNDTLTINDVKSNEDENKELTKPDLIGDYNIAYDMYKKNPNNQTLSGVVNALKNTINYTLSSNAVKGDPLFESKAKVITAQAVKSFNPSYNVSLPTYVSSQLQKMNRFIRESRQPIKIPERFIYDSQSLKNAEEELSNKYMREPTIEELSDYTGFSAKKIADIRNKSDFKQVSENNFYTSKDDENNISSNSEQPSSNTDFSYEAMDYVYNGLDYKSKKIWEYATGYGGAKILPFQDIAKKLNLSLSQVYRIAKNLTNKYINIKEELDKVYAK